MYYNTREYNEDEDYNRGLPQPMRRQKFKENDSDKKQKNDKRQRREAFERKRNRDF